VSTRDYIEKDYYKSLGITKDASPAEIKKVYRKLARDLHPDKNPGDTAAEARFKEVSEAYGVLSDAAKRKEYDEARDMFAAGGPGGFGGFGGGRGAPGGFNAPGGGQSFDMSDLFGGGGGSSSNLNDLFDNLFGGNAGRPSSSGPVRGQDLSADINLGFNEAVRGATLPLRLSGPGACNLCHGSGAKPGTSPRRCPTCQGTGMVSSNQGAFGFSEPCRDCRGTGQLIDDPCPQCHGSGTTTQTRTINVRIPAGVRDGGKVRIRGKGTPGRNGAPSGDLIVTVHVGRHDLFGRDGDNLTITAPITFAEAALGTTLRVPTLDGAVSVRIAPGTPSGRTLRVKGRGVQGKNRSGDLLVTVEVAIPQNMSAEAREALERYAAAQTDDPRPQITAALSTADAPAAANHA
jgi:molecular chaperone DnaJ